MLGNRKLVLDTHCEVFDQLRPWADAEFWNLGTHQIVPGAIYLVGRQQFKEHVSAIKQHIQDSDCLFILSNPHEGSDTIRWQISRLDIEDLVIDHKILIIGGGDIETKYPCLRYDSFMVKIFDYITNVRAAERVDDIFNKKQKPYKFLFLNGFARPHRKYLLESFRLSGILDQALWTCLDSKGFDSRILNLKHNGENLMSRPGVIQYLPERYEFPDFRDQTHKPLPTDTTFVKFHLFDDKWGEIYLHPEPYIDTYFSLVTETVFDYPYSFRTEKIWKPIAIGHPWIAVSNAGYYRDMRNLGFRTFDHLIDETFDSIDDNRERIKRISTVVHDLCQQDLSSFLAAAQEVCKYNQQHLRDLIPQERDGFSSRFANFIQPYIQ